MNILKRLLQAFAVLLLLIGGIGLFLPSKATMSRSVDVQAPPETVFGLLSSFKRFNEFSPWFEYDPQAQYLSSGPDSGVGAQLSWQSKHPNVGNGTQQIIALEPNKSVTTKLQFDAPGASTATWSLAPSELGTQVTWGLQVDSGWNVVGRWFGLFLERFTAKDFERGLTKLKALAETEAAKPKLPAASIEIVDNVAPFDIAFIAGRSEMDMAKINALLGDNFNRLGAFLQQHGLQPAGAVGAINRAISQTEWQFEAFIPFAGTPEAKAQAAAAGGEIQLGMTSGGRSIKIVHVGPYETMPQSYQRLAQYMTDNQLEASAASWEQYLNDPAQTPAAELVSHIFQPIK